MIVARVHFRVTNRLYDLLGRLAGSEHLPVAPFEARLLLFAEFSRRHADHINRTDLPDIPDYSRIPEKFPPDS